jgi:cyclophilin family peptidyl-prolyl cis-trans isomerase
VGTAKRERQKLGRQARVAAEMAAQQRRQRVKGVRNFVIIIVVIIAALFVLSRYNQDDSKSSSGGTPVSIPIPPAGATVTGATPCPAVDGSSPRTTKFASPPPTCTDPNKTYTATLATTKGEIAFTLDSAAAPIAVNNFVVLARYHFYDGVAFHRIVTGKLDQAGDATGPTPGAGDPGYTIQDEWPSTPNPYLEGSVAMANRGASNSSGSQFFIVIGAGGAGLPVQYTRFGSVTAGLDVANAINAVGSADNDGRPTEVVTITGVTITES